MAVNSLLTTMGLAGISAPPPHSVNVPKGTVKTCGCTAAAIQAASPFTTAAKVSLFRRNTAGRGMTVKNAAPPPPTVPSLMTASGTLKAVGNAPKGPFWFGTRVQPAPGTVSAANVQPRRALVLPVANLVPGLAARVGNIA